MAASETAGEFLTPTIVSLCGKCHKNRDFCTLPMAMVCGKAQNNPDQGQRDPWPSSLPSCRVRVSVAGWRPCSCLAPCPHPPEQPGGRGRFPRLCFPPRRAGLVHANTVAGRGAQQAARVCHTPAGGCRWVTAVLALAESVEEPVQQELFLCENQLAAAIWNEQITTNVEKNSTSLLCVLNI